MPGLPNADQAVIAPEKLTDYLLNLSHPRGEPKARFFLMFGFRLDDVGLFERALLAHGRSYPATTRMRKNGVSYAVDGALETPTGRWPSVRTVWARDDGEAAPRLVTAYPLDERDWKGVKDHDV